MANNTSVIVPKLVEQQALEQLYRQVSKKQEEKINQLLEENKVILNLPLEGDKESKNLKLSGLDNKIPEETKIYGSVVFGASNTVNASYGVGIGIGNIIENEEATGAFVSGLQNTVTAIGAQAGGYHNIASAPAQTVVGMCNQPEETAFFIVGGGTHTHDEETEELIRANCFTTGVDAGNSYIKIGNTQLTEAQLQKVIQFIESIQIE